MLVNTIFTIGMEMVFIRYELIKESLEELSTLERKAKEGMVRDRLRFLRLLKQNPQSTLVDAAAHLGYQKSWAYGLWKRYQSQGLAALSTYPFQGRKPRLDQSAQATLKESLKADHMATLRQAACAH